MTAGQGGLQPDPDTPVGEREQSEHRGARGALSPQTRVQLWAGWAPDDCTWVLSGQALPPGPVRTLLPPLQPACRSGCS